MKKYDKRLMLMLTLMLVFIVSCNGSSSSSTSPSILDVAGVWTFAGQLIQDTCGMGASQSFLGNFTFYQSGNSVSTGRIDFSIGNGSPYFTYDGTLTGANISMAAVDPYVLQSGGAVRHLGSGIDVQNIEDNVGSGSLNFTGVCIEGCNDGGCQTLWTGTWTKN